MSYQTYPTFWRGDVYYADLGKQIGSVQRGYRPVIIIQNNKGNLNGPTLVVVPVSTELKRMHMPVHVQLSSDSGLEEESMAMCEQITTINKSQIRSYVCTLPDDDLVNINQALCISLGIKPKDPYLQGPNEMVMTLCREHLKPYFYDSDYKVRRIDRNQTMEQCVCCDRLGFDYRVTRVKHSGNQVENERKELS